MARSSTSRRKRIALILGLLLITGLGVTAFFLPYLLKRYIENNSEAWIDRRITIGSIVLNPFTGVYAVHDLTCFEPRSEQVFVSFRKLGVKGNVLDGLRNGHWRFREAELRDPYFHVVQQGDRFNFSDLLRLREASGEARLEMGGEAEEAPADPSEVAFIVTDLAITGGRIGYLSDLLHEPLHVIDLDVTSTRITSGEARMDFRVGFGMPDGTRLDGGFMIDTDSAFYAVEAHLRNFGLAGSLPYLQDFFDAGSLTGRLDVDFNVLQSYADSSWLALSARVDLRELDLRDPRQEHLLALRHLHARLDTMVDGHIELGVVDVEGLDTRFALLADGTDNWTRLLKLVPDSTSGEGAMVLDASESNYFVLLAEYIGQLGAAFTASDYAADSIVFRDGRVLYEDHSIPRSFRYELTGIDVRAQRFDAHSATAPVIAKARLNNTGSMEARAAFDTRDFRNVQLMLRVDSLLLPHLDAYTRWYAAHPVEDGVLDYMSSTTIEEGMIDSRNFIHVGRLRFGKKVAEHDPETYVLPLRLAASLLKDVHGVVELDIPVKGDLRDPQFRVWPIVWQVLKNLVVKAAAAPVKLLAGAFDGADEKELEMVRFRALQGHVEGPQRRTLGQLAKALAAKPGLTVDLVPLVDGPAEAGELALFTAKARYLFPEKAVLAAADSARVMGLAERDSSFVRWMDGRSPGTTDRPMGMRSIALVGAAENSQAWDAIERARREQVMQALLAAGVEAGRLRFREGTPGETAAYKGPPGYLFVYGAE